MSYACANCKDAGLRDGCPSCGREHPPRPNRATRRRSAALSRRAPPRPTREQP